MAVNLGQLKTRILNEIGENTTSGQAIYEDRIVDAIATAIQCYEKEQFWFLQANTTLTLDASSTAVALPTSPRVVHVLGLRLSSNNTWYGKDSGFDQEDYLVMKAGQSSATNEGRPYLWALFGEFIYVEKITDQAYTLDLDYIKGDVNYPSEDADTSCWFGDGVNLIRTKALAILHRDTMAAEEKAVAYEQAAAGFYQDLLIRHNLRNPNRRLA